MRPVNLIPPEDRRGERAPLRTGPLAYILVGVLLLAFVGVYMTVSTGNTISEREAEVTRLQQDLHSATAQAEALKGFTSFASLEQSRTATIDSLARSRFDWERVMQELAYVIPAEVSLSTLSGAVSSEAAGNAGGDAAATTEGIAAPTLAMLGCAPSQNSVASFVAALHDIDGVTRVGLASSADTSADADSAEAGIEEADADCGPPTPVGFSIVVAFDEVQVDAATGGLTQPPPPAAPIEEDDSGVAEVEEGRAAAQDEVDSAQEKSREAVDEFVPGT